MTRGFLTGSDWISFAGFLASGAFKVFCVVVTVLIKGLAGALETDTVLPSVLTSISPFLVVSDVWLISIAIGVSVPFCVVSAYVLKAIRANTGIMIFFMDNPKI